MASVRLRWTGALVTVMVPHACALSLVPGSLVSNHARAPAAVKMAWVNDPHSSGMSYVEEEWIDASQAADRALLALGPSTELEPSTIVDMVMKGFQRGTNEDVEDLFQFVEPTGKLANSYQGSAGPMKNFRIKIRKEPRWKSIANRPIAALLHMRNFTIMGGVMTDPDVRVYHVRAEPFFPDAPQAESEVIFQFELVRQRASIESGITALGSHHKCWLIDSIEPKYSDWAVRDPIGIICPDVFKKPKRSAED